ncbi:MAG: hypothetical protein FWG57_02690 [Endomicrobia bacterium]|nr:hypothetical protein [Endomicrobiia bacterium]
MNQEKINFKDYMAHEPPMLFVDKVLEKSEKKAKTSFTVNKECIFLDESGVLARSALIEIAGQSFAAADILKKTMKGGKKDLKGFLVSVRDFKFIHDARAGDEIICDTEETNNIAQLRIVEAKLSVNGICIACGELRVFDKP